ncbi:MAG TPA: NAD(P)-dependent oxidoreductase [Bacteroidota bacterium]
MNVCVVGATGVLGRSLVPQLLADGCGVRALARFTPEKRSWLPKEADCRSFDLLSDDAPKQLPSLLNGMDAVFHIATAIPSDFTAPGAWDLNTKLRTEGTRRLVSAAIDAGIKYYVQQSITMRYPDLGDQWIDEDVPFAPPLQGPPESDPVTIMENHVKALHTKGIGWCILRGGIFVGPGTFQEGAIRKLKEGNEVIAGDGNEFVSLVHVADMASAFVKALHVRPSSGIFNIVAEPIRNGEYRDRLADSVGAARPKRDLNRPRPVSNRCSNARAKSVLQWSPQHSIFPT